MLRDLSRGSVTKILRHLDEIRQRLRSAGSCGLISCCIIRVTGVDVYICIAISRPQIRPLQCMTLVV